jgi:chaperonin GroEL (HSP60 family)
MVSLSPQAAVEEGIVVGGGCTLLRLAAKVDAIKDTLENDEQKVRMKSVMNSFISKRRLQYTKVLYCQHL